MGSSANDRVSVFRSRRFAPLCGFGQAPVQRLLHAGDMGRMTTAQRRRPHFSHSMPPAPVQQAGRAEAARSSIWWIGLAVSFQEVVHPALTEESEVTKLHDSRRTEWTTIRMPVWFDLVDRTSAATHPVGVFNPPSGLPDPRASPASGGLCPDTLFAAPMPYLPRRAAFAGASAGRERARRSPQGEDGNRNAGDMECEQCGLGLLPSRRCSSPASSAPRRRPPPTRATSMPESRSPSWLLPVRAVATISRHG